jgi:murein DD-endopeptidase MepM/ murein hydrolase activator NlpD
VNDARAQAARRLATVAIVAGLVSLPSAAIAAPGAPQQEDPAEGETGGVTTRALVGLETSLISGNAGAVAGALNELEANVEAQLALLEAADRVMADAVSTLADRDAAVLDTERQIEELTARSDDVMVDAFVSPPAEDALAVLASDSVAEMSVRQAVLDMQNEAFAADLAALDRLRNELQQLKLTQEEAVAAAEAAQAEAEAALADLETAVSQQAQFVRSMREQLAAGAIDLEALRATDPERAEQLLQLQADLQTRLAEAEAAAARRAALELIAEAERRAAELGIWKCPVQGQVRFNDTWGAARSGGRSHKGTDMLAAMGTPTVAPVSGRVEHRTVSLGGLSWYVYGDDGHTYFGTHLSGYENVGAGHVERGTVIGYVGDSGNAAGTPHLHFEYHPGGGSAINPYPRLVEVC